MSIEDRTKNWESSGNPDALKLATLDELFEEIASRTSACVLLVNRKVKDQAVKETEDRMWYEGGYHACLGLLTSFLHSMLIRRWEPKDAP